MSMTPSRLGVANLTSDGSYAQDNALFLQVYAGEVLTAFEEYTVMKDLHLVRTIDHGKSASFPATWKCDAGYHTPGNALTGSQKVAANERIIKIDDLLVSDIFIADIDEAKNHYDVRGIYSAQQGQALARAFDKAITQVGVLAARAAATVTGGDGGTVLNGGATAATDANVLLPMFWNASLAMDQKFVPESERYAIVRPAQFHLLMQADKLTNSLYNGGMPIYRDGADTLKVDNITIRKSPNLPSTVVAAKAGENNAYGGDFTKTVGLVFHKTAVGTVKLMDLAIQQTSGDFNVQYQGTLMVAKYAMGHGILRPEAAVELTTA